MSSETFFSHEEKKQVRFEALLVRRNKDYWLLTQYSEGKLLKIE